MYFILNMLGIFVVILIIFLCLFNKKYIKWRLIVIFILLEFFIMWFMLGIKFGSIIINKIVLFFSWLLVCVNEGI